jgi:hypothetical protein
MLKPLRYFFLRVYEFKLRSQPDVLAAFTAAAATAAAVFLHVLTLWIVFDRMFAGAAHLPHGRDTARAVGLTVILLIAAAFYQAWIASGRYRSFREEFRAETHDQRQVRTVFVILYAVLSFLLPVVLIFALPT